MVLLRFYNVTQIQFCGDLRASSESISAEQWRIYIGEMGLKLCFIFDTITKCVKPHSRLVHYFKLNSINYGPISSRPVVKSTLCESMCTGSPFCDCVCVCVFFLSFFSSVIVIYCAVFKPMTMERVERKSPQTD